MRLRKSAFFLMTFRIFLFLILLLPVYLYGNKALKCDICGKVIRSGQNYYKNAGKNCCSRACAERAGEKTLPVCSACGKKIRGSYLMSKGKAFCSQKCYESKLPVCSVCGKHSMAGALAADNSFFACSDCLKKPRCFSCQIPTDGRVLSDGRSICANCSKTAISDISPARSLFRKVRAALKYRLGLSTEHPIGFFLTDQKQLHKKSRGISGSTPEQGLFEYLAEITVVEKHNLFGKKVSQSESKTSERFNIYVLDFLPEERMEYVIAHELGHDWQVTHYPGISDLAVKEGFAEYVGWLYNRLCKRDTINRRIEMNQDPVYGGGFRKIKAIADKDGFEGVKRFLESQREKK